MKLAFIGTGYVGLVSGACFAESGNDVTCVDIDESKIGALNEGQIPIYEVGLEDLIRRNVSAKRLSFTTDVARAIREAEVVFIAVGTPVGPDRKADLTYVLQVAETIGKHLSPNTVVVTKSTVPVGTSEIVKHLISNQSPPSFHIASNPEFLKEGTAVEDFFKPDRVVIGSDSAYALSVLRTLYAPFVRNGHPILEMSVRSAELTKYAANAMLATRLSFMNEMADLCEATGASVDDVRLGIGSDARIGSAFLYPGPNFSGSCLTKDLNALLKTAEAYDVDLRVAAATLRANEERKGVLANKVRGKLGSVLGKTIAVWGLAFKAGTDDIRDSSAITLVDAMLANGAKVVVHDPKAAPNFRKLFQDRISYVEDPYAALLDADALVVATEWLTYRTPDFVKMRASMRMPVLIDGRNLYDPAHVRALGFTYDSVGRP